MRSACLIWATLLARHPSASAPRDLHNHNFGVSTSLTPRGRYGIDLAYNYNGFQQNALTCFNDTPAGVTLPVLANPTGCAALDSGNPASKYAYYKKPHPLRNRVGHAEAGETRHHAFRLWHHQRGRADAATHLSCSPWVLSPTNITSLWQTSAWT